MLLEYIYLDFLKMIRTEASIKRDAKKRELRGNINEVISKEKNWNIIIEVLSEILTEEIIKYNKETNKNKKFRNDNIY